MDEKIKEDIIEKTRKIKGYFHPCNKERQEDMKRLQFVSGFEYNNWLINLIEEKKKEKKENEWYKKLENKYGKEFVQWGMENKIRKCVLSNGCKTETEYKNILAKKRGYNDNAELRKEIYYNNGTRSPPSENEYCSDFLGKYIGEELFKQFLEKVMFEFVNKIGKGSGDKGIDFLCTYPMQGFIDIYNHLKLEMDKEYRIQLKIRCLTYRDKRIYWNFRIDYNKNADLFILCGFDNRKELNILHIWIFKKDDIIRGEKFWKRDGLYINNRSEYLAEFEKYELKDYSEIFNEILAELKKEMKI